MRFIVKVKMPNLNEYINIERTNRYGAAGQKKKATNSVAIELRSQSKKNKLNGLYDLEIYWITPNNRQDPDNIYFKTKFILDGFVISGLLPGDGRKNIRHIDHRIRTIKGKEMVVIRLIEVLSP